MNNANLTTHTAQKNTLKHTLSFSALTLAVLIGITGCSSDDGKNCVDGIAGTDGQNGTDGTNGNPGFASATFILANNGETNTGTIDLIDQSASKLKTFNTTANEGVAIDSLGN